MCIRHALDVHWTQDRTCASYFLDVYLYMASQSTPPRVCNITRVGQNRICTPIMTVCLLKCLQKYCIYTPYIYGFGQFYIYTYTPYIYGIGQLHIYTVHIWYWPILYTHRTYMVLANYIYTPYIYGFGQFYI